VKHLALFTVLLAALLAALGCRDPSMKDLSDRAKKMKDYEQRTIRVPKNFPKTNGTPTSRSAQPPQQSLDTIAQAYEATRPVTRDTGTAEAVAVKKVAAAVRASLEIGPTLVVWIIDRTPSAQKIVTSGLAAARAVYDAEDIRTLSLNGGQQLQTAVIAFDDETEFLLDPPTGDWQAAQAGLDKFQSSTAGQEHTFAAVKQALDKYAPLRTAAENRREIVLVVITDEAGEDGALVDELATTVRKLAIPVYCLGSPAPWGQVNPLAADPKQGDPTKTDDSVPRYGPESFASERVDIEMLPLNASVGLDRDEENLSHIDSGFGPFALERLCRAGGGEFFSIRPDVGSQYEYRGQSYDYWPTGSELRFAGAEPAKYAPDYVSAQEHRRLVAENKARQALESAAGFPRLMIGDYPELRFPKGSESQFKRSLDQAQQYAARHAPAVDKFYSALSVGEGDRDRLTSPRLQAEFDLALGCAAAIKARIDGYNSMIAALKRGKNFANPASREWILEPADLYETDSSIRKLAERAKASLQRVTTEHPGTPWAKLAERELRSPLGWTWKEG
jgi:hypothetical protein